MSMEEMDSLAFEWVGGFDDNERGRRPFGETVEGTTSRTLSWSWMPDRGVEDTSTRVSCSMLGRVRSA
jgi:hypothetical protein